jgi:hypothetical protein
MIVTLARVALIHPLGDMGDRNIQGLSTLIASDEWHIEAFLRRDASVGDVRVYRNINSNINRRDRTTKPDWRFFTAVPTSNIKGYVLEGNPPPQHESVKPHEQAESKEAVAELDQAKVG